MVQAGRPLVHMFFVRLGLISLTLPPSTAAAVGHGEAPNGHANGHVQVQVPGDVVFNAEGAPRPGTPDNGAAEVAVVGPGGWFCEAALLGPPPETVRGSREGHLLGVATHVSTGAGASVWV